MPFGKYKDFNDYVLKNRDKTTPKAYCGFLQNKIEDIDTAGNKQNLSTADIMCAEKELAETTPASSAQSWATFKVGFDKKKKKKTETADWGAMVKYAKHPKFQTKKFKKAFKEEAKKKIKPELGKCSFASYAESLKKNTEDMIKISTKSSFISDKINKRIKGGER